MADQEGPPAHETAAEVPARLPLAGEPSARLPLGEAVRRRAGDDSALEASGEDGDTAGATLSSNAHVTGATARPVGWREVVLVAASIVAGVLGLAMVTSVLPTGLQDLVFRTPLTIVVLVVVTTMLLIRLGRGSTT